MTPDEIMQAITDACPGTHVDTTTPDYFFFNDPERKFPFATIVTRDTAFDHVSQLDRPSAFRLNLGLGRATFRERFPEASSEPFDFTTFDRLMPHPLYAKMYWICVLNPTRATFEALRPLLADAYEASRVRYGG